MKLSEAAKQLEDKVEELNYLKDRAIEECVRMSVENINLKAEVNRLTILCSLRG